MNARRLLAMSTMTVILGAAVLFAVESGAGTPAAKPMGTREISAPVKVCVSNVEGLWRYTYGARCGATNAPDRLPYSYHDLVVPADSQVDLVVTADRGQHLLNVRDLGLTIDAEPIAARRTSFRTMGAGETYKAICAENCGHDRASASAEVVVVTEAGYRKWLTSQAHAIAAQGAQVSRLRTRLIDEGVFARPVAMTKH